MGTERVGRLFGPIMALWFVVLVVLGLPRIIDHPDVLLGLSPTYIVSFFADHPYTAFIAMGAVVLAITGAEALYADMGHFGRRPIRRAWFVAGVPGADHQLPRPGRADPARPGGGVEPLLPARSRPGRGSR